MSERTGRAMVFVGPNRPLESRRLRLPKLREGEVLVRVDCRTLCGSDVHTYLGRRAGPLPVILGHEMTGVIESIGGAADDFHGLPLSVGERVTWGIAVGCGQCYYCAISLPQKCQRLFKYGHQPMEGNVLFSGALAEYCHLIAGTAIFRLPAAVASTELAPSNCATATVFHALRRSGTVAGRHVLIVGAGMLGLTACAACRVGQAEQVIVVEPRAERRALALEFGASSAVDFANAEQEIRQCTGGRGVDLCLEMSGHTAAVELGIDALRIAGQAVLVGAVFPDCPLQLVPETIVRRMLSVVGVHNYHPADLDVALQFLERWHQRFPFSRLTPVRFPLESADQAFLAAASGEYVRVAITDEF